MADLAPEFKLATGSPVTLDNTQAPVLVDGKFWFWVKGDAGATGTTSIIWLKETWSYTAADGQEVFYAGGAYQDAENVWQGEVASTVASIPVFMVPYIDVRLVPSVSGEIDDATLQSFAASGATLFRIESSGNKQISQLAAALNKKPWVSLGGGKLRLFFDPNDSDGITAGAYTLTVAANAAWQDSADATSDQDKSFSFTLVDPIAEVVSPVSATRPSVDVHVANAPAAMPSSTGVKGATGASVDYASILDEGQIHLGGLAGLTTVNGRPTPIAMVIGADGLASFVEINNLDLGISSAWMTTDWNGDGTVDVDDRDFDGNGTANEDSDLYLVLAQEGVTQFRTPRRRRRTSLPAI